MKVSQTLSKTIEAATATDLDTAYATFVRTLGEEKVVSHHFAYVSGNYVVVIIYSQ